MNISWTFLDWIAVTAIILLLHFAAVVIMRLWRTRRQPVRRDSPTDQWTSTRDVWDDE